MCALALAGHDVVGVDTDPARLSPLQRASEYGSDPDLVALLRAALESGRVRLSDQPVTAQAHIVCVPTPARRAEPFPRCDLTAVMAAADALRGVVRPGDLVVLESTVPPGTTRGIFRDLVCGESTALRRGVSFAHVPERIIPGNTVFELYNNDRVIGVTDDRARQQTADLYGSFVKGGLNVTTPEMAELVKLSENAFRDVNIALANQFALVCEALGLDVWELIGLANKHPRVSFLEPGPGVGGHCIPIDPWFVVEAAATGEADLLIAARRVNGLVNQRAFERILEVGRLAGSDNILLLGRAYKRNVPDCRESPALAIASRLRGSGMHVRIYDPIVEATGQFPHDLYRMTEDVSLVACLVDHDVFKVIDPFKIGSRTGRKHVFDARNFLNASRWSDAGWTVHRLGVAGCREGYGRDV